VSEQENSPPGEWQLTPSTIEISSLIVQSTTAQIAYGITNDFHVFSLTQLQYFFTFSLS
jgi:hypothetical protein